MGFFANTERKIQFYLEDVKYEHLTLFSKKNFFLVMLVVKVFAENGQKKSRGIIHNY